MKILKNIVTVVFMVSMLFALAACSGDYTSATSSAPAVTSNDPTDSDKTISILSDTKEIKLKKAGFSLGDSWTVSTSSGEVASIKGQAIYMIGDTYSLFTPSGNLVASEGEALKLANRSAAFYDYENNMTHSMSQSVFSWLYEFKLYDPEDNMVATAHQKFSMGLDGEIKNSSGEVVWKFDRALMSFGADITLTRVADSDVTAIQAIWMAVIMNEIYEADQEEE